MTAVAAGLQRDKGSLVGVLAMLPLALVLAAGFVLPLALVGWMSLMPPRTFGLDGGPTLANYRAVVAEGYLWPLLSAVRLAALATAVSLVIAWPCAKALTRYGGRFALVVTILVALPIFISESVRLFGASILLMPGGGILAGTIRSLFGVNIGSVLYTETATLLGLVYVYFPFVLFPTVLGLAMVPRDQVEAARDLGAGSFQVFREIELPIAAPGLIIGALLCFVLSVGANAEANILGGQAVTVIAKVIDQRFTYAQDWPLGSALTVIVTVIIAIIVLPAMRRLDLARLMKR